MKVLKMSDFKIRMESSSNPEQFIKLLSYKIEKMMFKQFRKSRRFRRFMKYMRIEIVFNDSIIITQFSQFYLFIKYRKNRNLFSIELDEGPGYMINLNDPNSICKLFSIVGNFLNHKRIAHEGIRWDWF